MRLTKREDPGARLRARVTDPTATSGVVDLTWTPANVSPATYPLVAFLDDGAEVHEVPAGETAVPP